MAIEQLEVSQVIRATKRLKLMSFGVEHNEKQYSVSTFLRQEKSGLFKFDDPLQRGIVWSLLKRSELIHTILSDLYVPAIVAQLVRVDDNVRIKNIIDGVQRLTSIRDFVRGSMVLSKVTPFLDAIDVDGKRIKVDIRGKKFEDLPQDFQDKITGFTLHIQELEVDDDTKKIIFGRLNNGVPLRPHERRKSLMSTELMQYLSDMRRLPIYAMAPGNSLSADYAGELALQSLMVIRNKSRVSLTSKVTNEFVESGHANDKNLQAKVQKIALYLSEATLKLDELTYGIMSAKSRIMALFPVAEVAIEYKISTDQFIKWMKYFFIQTYNTREFKKLTIGRTNNASSILLRHSEAVNDAIKFFEIKDIEVSEVVEA